MQALVNALIYGQFSGQLEAASVFAAGVDTMLMMIIEPHLDLGGSLR